MDRGKFLTACSLLIGIHLLIGVFAVWDNGYFVLGVFAPERFLVHMLRDDGSRFTVSGSVIYYLNDICVQSCESCEFLCYPKENLKIVCNEVGCGLESHNDRVILAEGESPYLIAKEGILYEGTYFICNRMEGFCSISTELNNNTFYDIRLPKEIPFYRGLEFDSQSLGNDKDVLISSP